VDLERGLLGVLVRRDGVRNFLVVRINEPEVERSWIEKGAGTLLLSVHYFLF
jgi:hypothetical protein